MVPVWGISGGLPLVLVAGASLQHSRLAVVVGWLRPTRGYGSLPIHSVSVSGCSIVNVRRLLSTFLVPSCWGGAT